MTRSLRLAASLLLALAVSVSLAVGQAPPKTVALTILHTNDTHGHLLPFSYADATAATDRQMQGMRVHRNIGGIARRATLVNRIRAEQKDRNIPVWLMDAGDYNEGTAFSAEYHGEADVAAMNAVGYDFGTLGNHEFSNSAAQVRKLIAATKYQVVSANIVDRATGQPLVAPYVIRNVDGIRVAVFGLQTHEAASYRAGKEAFDVTDEIDAARKVVSALHSQADIIVLLSHAGEQMDARLAAAVPDIDIIVGGHSHTRMADPRIPYYRSDDLRQANAIGPLVVQAYQWGGELGRLDVVFARDEKGAWHVERYRERLIPITQEIEPDPEVAAVVDKFWAPIAAHYGEVIGQAAGEFSKRGDDWAEYNLVADAVRETFDTDFDMENTSGVRAPLLQGPITLGDLSALDPFNNTVVLFAATGREIRQILERYRPHVSGMKYRLQDRKLVDVAIGGRPLEDDRTYRGATNSYFAATYLKGMGLATTDTGKGRLDVVMAYIRKKGTVSPAYDGRRLVPGEDAR